MVPSCRRQKSHIKSCLILAVIICLAKSIAQPPAGLEPAAFWCPWLKSQTLYRLSYGGLRYLPGQILNYKLPSGSAYAAPSAAPPIREQSCLMNVVEPLVENFATRRSEETSVSENVATKTSFESTLGTFDAA